eukprot:CAMPEP_0117442336 /NCGR_PEP_ID=MMETSP0759-20121206/4097_1 /TAXON_ID=63605 /ORGANISM="Percolomonas cosmopolitus, Strain WS" /LENGTH=1536 /DNA_ID=CAMNT_0005234217 /DNA_START=1180 /DNA_END=5790 /DNA_ORIENTATION=+
MSTAQNVTPASVPQPHASDVSTPDSSQFVTVRPPVIIQSLNGIVPQPDAFTTQQSTRKRSLTQLHQNKIPYPQQEKRQKQLTDSLEMQFRAVNQRKQQDEISFNARHPHKFSFNYAFDSSIHDRITLNGSTPLDMSKAKASPDQFINIFRRIMSESAGFQPNLTHTEYINQLQKENEEFANALVPRKKFHAKSNENIKDSWKVVCGQIQQHYSQWTKQHDTCKILAQKMARRNLLEFLTNIKRTIRVTRDQVPTRARKVHKSVSHVWKTEARSRVENREAMTSMGVHKKETSGAATTGPSSTTAGTVSTTTTKTKSKPGPKKKDPSEKEKQKRNKKEKAAKDKELKVKQKKEKKEAEKAAKAVAAAKAKEEREAIKKKQEEEERLRNERKLNFLLTQTELYTHFMASGGKQKASLEAPDDALKDVLPQEIRDSLNQQPSNTATAKSRSKKKVKELEQEAKISEDQAIANARRAFEAQRKQTDEFDQAVAQFREMPGGAEDGEEADITSDDLHLQEPELLEGSTIMQEPPGFQGQLKEYQKKGLTWLAMLYEQGINGILADEMGLGKTVQTIAFLGHLALNKNIWGPFVVIAPSSTLHNWQAEIEKFCPALRALPYWGSPKDRKVLRRYWNEDSLYKKDSRFHVLVTSYGLLMEDLKLFNRIRWQYLILDEAHWIKSAKSQRWQSLLSFRCRNRLLLTGTPIQNNMAELWALLHFIMPSLFDSHDEFNEWFSKDIESKAAKKGSKLNNEQLKRLHLILKPFMLRRIKKDVESEMPKKKEITLCCGYSSTQLKIIQQLKHQITSRHYGTVGTATARNSMLKNLVMQFRKVCNHPQLFRKESVHSAFACRSAVPIQSFLPKEITGRIPECFADANRSFFSFSIPRLVYQHGGVFSGHRDENAQGDWDNTFRQQTVFSRMFDVFSRENIYASIYEGNGEALSGASSATREYGSTFSFLKFVDVSVGEADFLFHASLVERFVFFIAELQRLYRVHYVHNTMEENIMVNGATQDHKHEFSFPRSAFRKSAMGRVRELYRPTSLVHHTSLHLHPKTRKMWSELIFTSNPSEFYTTNEQHIIMLHTQRDRCVAAPVNFLCSDRRFAHSQREFLFNSWLKQWLIGFSPTSGAFRLPLFYYTKTGSLLNQVLPRVEDAPQRSAHSDGLLTPYINIFKTNSITMPSVSRLISQSGKLRTMDTLLKKLKKEGHRVLIFSQMTRMLDLIEQYMWARNHRFLRLDGQSTVQDRRDMVQAFQKEDDIFAFLLSTRAGGLGITLTAADTVIFYDCDWNPTSDQQAMDRCHRIGQDKNVTVYRIVTKGSVEERILAIAQRKQRIQNTVYSGEFKTFDDTSGGEDGELLDAIFEDSDLKEHKESFLMEKQKSDLEDAKAKAAELEAAAAAAAQEPQKKRRGRKPGSKNKTKVDAASAPDVKAEPKKRGRKPGSKNKKKASGTTAKGKKGAKSGKASTEKAAANATTTTTFTSGVPSAAVNGATTLVEPKLKIKLSLGSPEKQSSKKRKRPENGTSAQANEPETKKAKTNGELSK